LRLIELDAEKLPATVKWVVGKMGDPAPAVGEGETVVHYLVPDGCVHVYGAVPTSAIVREDAVPLEGGVHTFPEWL
jgi:hypothetical protein